MSSTEAIRIFEAIPEAGDAVILKRDILGIGSPSLALSPPVDLTGLLQLLASDLPSTIPTENEFRRRFEALPAEQVGILANYADRHGPPLSRWKELIEAGVIGSADRDTLIGEIRNGSANSF